MNEVEDAESRVRLQVSELRRNVRRYASIRARLGIVASLPTGDARNAPQGQPRGISDASAWCLTFEIILQAIDKRTLPYAPKGERTSDIVILKFRDNLKHAEISRRTETPYGMITALIERAAELFEEESRARELLRADMNRDTQEWQARA